MGNTNSATSSDLDQPTKLPNSRGSVLQLLSSGRWRKKRKKRHSTDEHEDERPKNNVSSVEGSAERELTNIHPEIRQIPPTGDKAAEMGYPLSEGKGMSEKRGSELSLPHSPSYMDETTARGTMLQEHPCMFDYLAISKENIENDATSDVNLKTEMGVREDANNDFYREEFQEEEKYWTPKSTRSTEEPHTPHERLQETYAISKENIEIDATSDVNLKTEMGVREDANNDFYREEFQEEEKYWTPKSTRSTEEPHTPHERLQATYVEVSIAIDPIDTHPEIRQSLDTGSYPTNVEEMETRKSTASSDLDHSTKLPNSRGGMLQRLRSGWWKKKRKKKIYSIRDYKVMGNSTSAASSDLHHATKLPNSRGSILQRLRSGRGKKKILKKRNSIEDYEDESPKTNEIANKTSAASSDLDQPTKLPKSRRSLLQRLRGGRWKKKRKKRCSVEECEEESPKSNADGPLNRDVMSIVEKHIGCDWKMLARQLSLDDACVQSIETDRSNYTLCEMAHNALAKWQQRKAGAATIRALVANLEKIERNDIAARILTTLPNLSTSMLLLASSLSGASSVAFAYNQEQMAVLKTVQTNLTDNYQHFEMKGLPWMKDLSLTLEDYYVDLFMNVDERGQQTSQQLKIEEIFSHTKGEGSPLRILIEGGPGSGKTTIAAKLAYDWAKGQVYINHFDLVLFLQLRLILDNWGDALAHACLVQGKDKEYFRRFVNEEAFTILFIFDGYDEASSQTKKEILQVIQKRLYTKSTVIITSRTGKLTSNRDVTDDDGDVAPTFSRFLSKRLTVKGFNERQQNIFIEKHMTNYPDEMKNTVRSKFNKMVDKEVLSCPLFLLMLIVLFTSGKDVESTETKTGLYKHVFNSVIKRYFTKNRSQIVHEVDLFCNHEDIPPYIQLMSQFSKFALKSLNRNSVMVSKEEIIKTYECDPEILELGFLTQYETSIGFRKCVLYGPVYKSLLEFAAAYGLYLSYDASRGFASTAEIIESQPTETPSLFFPFLVGLMGDNAGAVFKLICPYAFEYSCKFELLYDSLLEISLKEPILQSLSAFLPPEWSIYSHTLEQKPSENNFCSSSQHEALVGWGVRQSKIRQINLGVLQYTCLPASMVVDALVLGMSQVEYISNLLETMKIIAQNNIQLKSQNKLQCKYLWCSFSDSACKEGMPWEDFFDLLQFIEFEHISFDFFHYCVESEHMLSPRLSNDPLKHVYTAINTGKLKEVHLHSMSAGIYSNNPNWINSINDLIKMERIEVLELRIDGIIQVEINQLLKCAADSTNLKTIALSTTLAMDCVKNLPFTVSLDKLCGEERKSWKWVELSSVRVDVNETAVASFFIEHLEITSCWFSSTSSKVMLRCHSKSINCAASLLTDTWNHWSCQKSLTELNISVDTPLLNRGLSSLTGKLQNVEILSLTMTSFQRSPTSLPIEEWISNAISGLRLKGFEIWRFSKNTDLAIALVKGFIKYLEQHTSASFSSEMEDDSLLSVLPSMEKMHMYFMINGLKVETVHHATNCLQGLKECLQKKLLQRLELVFSTDNSVHEYGQTCNLFSKYSIKQEFPHQEGFRVEHDLWGSGENDSIYSKGKCSISRKQKHRISITLNT